MIQTLQLILLAFLSISSALAEIPTGVWVLQDKKACHRARIEFTGQADVYYKSYRNVLKGRVQESPEGLKVTFSPARKGEKSTALTLSKDGSDWLDQDGDRWVSRESLLQTSAGWSPVHLKVQSRKEGGKDAALLTGDFQYSYWIERAEGNWDPLLVRRLSHNQDQGDIIIKAPEKCQIHLSIRHPDVIEGYNNQPAQTRVHGEKSLNVWVNLGRKITGKIIDDDTENPIEGAEVTPMMFTPPSFSPNPNKVVVTGQDGTFEIRGVDFSFSVEHQDYVAEEVFAGEDPEKNTPPPSHYIVRLKAGGLLRGVVSDSAGNPIEGVEVTSYSGKTTFSGKNGSFEMKGLRTYSEQWSFSLSKKGYNEMDLEFSKLGIQKKHHVTMTSLPTFMGKVIFADGSPVTEYRLISGPGKSPASYECLKTKITDPHGEFSILAKSLAEKGSDYWLGIGTPDAAPWMGTFTSAQLTSGELVVTLSPGVSLTAKLDLPDGAKMPLQIKLTPTDQENTDSFMDSSLPGKRLATHQAKVPVGKPFLLTHLRAGRYQLVIRSSDTTPILRYLEIKDQNLDLGTITMQGTGSISGVVHEAYDSTTPWSYADGEIFVEGLSENFFDSYLQFKADDQGRFQIDGVPCGLVHLSFSYHESADIIGSMGRSVYVVEGKTSEVRLQGDKGPWSQSLQLTYGGKSIAPSFQTKREVNNVTDTSPSFSFRPTPLGNHPASAPVDSSWDLDDKSSASLSGISPGRWKIQVFDWLGSRGFNDGLRAETDIEIKAGKKRQTITINLGDRAISGKVTSKKETHRYIRIIAIDTQSKQVYYSRCDKEGDFVIRYIPNGSYQLYAHDDDGGWVSMRIHTTSNPLTDVGISYLDEGGHIAGQLAANIPINRNTRITARGPNGVIIPLDTLNPDGSFRFGNLPPGKWKVKIKVDQKTLTSQSLTVIKGKTIVYSSVMHDDDEREP